MFYLTSGLLRQLAKKCFTELRIVFAGDLFTIIDEYSLIIGVNPVPKLVFWPLAAQFFACFKLFETLLKTSIFLGKVIECRTFIILDKHPEGWGHWDSEVLVILNHVSANHSSNEIVAFHPLWIGHARVQSEAVAFSARLKSSIGCFYQKRKHITHEFFLHHTLECGILFIWIDTFSAHIKFTLWTTHNTMLFNFCRRDTRTASITPHTVWINLCELKRVTLLALLFAIEHFKIKGVIRVCHHGEFSIGKETFLVELTKAWSMDKVRIIFFTKLGEVFSLFLIVAERNSDWISSHAPVLL